MTDPKPTDVARATASENRRLANDTWEALFAAQATVIKRLQRDEVFDEVSLKEYDVLYSLSKWRDRWSKLSTLTQTILLTQPSISRLVDRLVTRGLIERTSDPDDRRGVLLRLTPAGLALQRRVGARHLRDIDATIGPALSAREKLQLLKLSTKLRQRVLEQDPL